MAWAVLEIIQRLKSERNRLKEFLPLCSDPRLFNSMKLRFKLFASFRRTHTYSTGPLKGSCLLVPEKSYGKTFGPSGPSDF